MQEVVQKVNQFLAESVDPIQRRFLFQGRPSEATLSDTPMILMIGNHSSGKSSFINYFIRQDIQLTGMAPTDEDFTILRYGATEKDRTGSSVISNPELGYEGLSQFGPRFLSHLKMKSLPLERLEKLSLVDTPGMIDSADSQAHRGFDFQGAVRWFAERADLVMLFFDPERPGTTAETLKVYTESLRDFDHKLLVVLNKVDQFRKLSDFARCYGTLCWNLGKVMRTKDLPQIYVTFLPVEGVPPSVLPMSEFVKSRKHLIQKMEQTSLQRTDNILTDVMIYLDRLLLHTQVLDTARRWLSSVRRKTYGMATCLLGMLAGWSFYLSGWDMNQVYATIIGGGVGIFILAHLFIKILLKQKEWWYSTHSHKVFETYAAKFKVRNDRYEHLKSHWQLIGPQTIRALKDLGIPQLPKIKKKEVASIMNWVESTLPELRRAVHLSEHQNFQNQSSNQETVSESPMNPTDEVVNTAPSKKESDSSSEVDYKNTSFADLNKNVTQSKDSHS